MSQRWACLFVFNKPTAEKLEELRAVIESADVLWFFAHYPFLMDGMKLMTDVLKNKTLVLYREIVAMPLQDERIAELARFVEEIGAHADRVVIHLPRHKLVFEPIAKLETIRTGLVVPYVLTMQFDYKRELRFIHYQSADKWWKGSDIVDELKHLPHVIVGSGEGALTVRYFDVLLLQAASELVVHPTRVDAFSRFLLQGILLGCVPVMMLSDAELWFVYGNCDDKFEAMKQLSKYFPIAVDKESYISLVNHLFQHRDEIYRYREKVREWLLHNPDFWCPSVIYEEFAKHDLFLPSDLMPVTLIDFAGKETLPIGKWSNNPPSIIFRT